MLSRLRLFCSLYTLPQYAVDRLQSVQNGAARAIFRLPLSAHVSPALTTLRWLPIKHQIQHRLLCLTHRAVHSGKPSYLAAQLHQRRNQTIALRSNDSQLLVVPRTRSRYGDRSFAVAAPQAWNALTYELRTTTNYNEFKTKLNEFLFSID